MRGTGERRRVHVISRTVQARGGDERDYPVSARRSMPDGFVIFDDAFVPHEHVFLDGVAAQAGSSRIPWVCGSASAGPR